RGEARTGRVARIVVAGAGAIGASVAYHLASLGARDVVLADRQRVVAGATSKAMGGVRQQFSTAAEVRLAQASIRFFEELGSPLSDLPDDLPMVLEAENGFHFRRRGDCLVLAMVDPEPRWGFEERVDESLFDDRLARLHHRYPPARETTIERAWAGLYDMTPDAHPILGEVADGVYAACGFSGHGFMQSPAVGRALAEEILGESPS